MYDRRMVWIDYDDGHAGGYPHECDRNGMYEVTTTRRSWRVCAKSPDDALTRIPGALTARYMCPAPPTPGGLMVSEHCRWGVLR